MDHKPLTSMLSNKFNNMMEGWADTIMSFNFTTCYIPSKDNFFVDTLSQQFELVNNIQVKQSILLSSSIQYEAEKCSKIISTETK